MKSVGLFWLVSILLIFSDSSIADFNFYEEKCLELAELGCKTPLVPGPCLITARGACKEFERVKDCHWKAVLLGAPIWTCKVVNGACKAYHEVCKEYKKVCRAGYKESCKTVLRPWGHISDEFFWLAYQEYMNSLESNNKGPIHKSIREELQQFYKIDLNSISVSTGDASDGSAITDCTHIRFPQSSLVKKILSGKRIENKEELKLFLHELKHSEQCKEIGGRKKYAILWFSQFEITIKLRIDEMINDLINLLKGKDLNKIHDAMPMENDAEQYASNILPEVIKNTRHGKSWWNNLFKQLLEE